MGRPSREVGRGSGLRIRRHRNIAHFNSAPGGAGHTDVNSISTEAAGVLEEVVFRPRGGLPGAAAVRADLERGDGLVGVDDLHAEPVRAGAGLVVQHDGRRDAAGHLDVRRGDLACRNLPELLEGVFEEVQVAFVALGTLVDDLGVLDMRMRSFGSSGAGVQSDGGPYHDSDGVTIGTSDLETSTALSGIIPG